MDKLIKDNVKVISQEMESAVQSVAKKYNLVIESNGARYTQGEGTFKFKVRLVAPAEGVYTPEQSAYDVMQTARNLPKRDSRVKAVDGTVLELIGWKSRARKYPIVAVNVASGERYVLSVEYVKNCTEV